MGERRCQTGALVTETKSQKQILHMTMAARRVRRQITALRATLDAVLDPPTQITIPDLPTTEHSIRYVREVFFRELERVKAADGERGEKRFFTEIGVTVGTEGARSGGACCLKDLVANIDHNGLAVLSTRT